MYFLVFGGGAPDIVPVNIGMRTRSSTNDFQHPFCGIGVKWARVSTIALEVFGKDVCVFTDFAKIDGFTTFGEEQETMETLEEHGGWLMDLAQSAGL